MAIMIMQTNLQSLLKEMLSTENLERLVSQTPRTPQVVLKKNFFMTYVKTPSE